MARPRIDPLVWHAPKAGGPPRPGLPPLTLWQVPGHGPEDVLVTPDGILTGVDDGRVLRFTPDGRTIETVADTGGRPLGLETHPDGILVCDADRGLLLLRDGHIEVLIPAGPDLRVCNNAAVAADGTVYFSDSTSRFDLEFWRADMLEHSGTGRLLRRTPDGAVDVLLGGLHFANGVALTPDESAVIVAQTWEYRLDRVWLTGPRAGQSDVLVDNLPALPDNISLGTDGLIWIGMANPRDRRLDTLLRLPPAIRRLVWNLPDAIQPAITKTAWARAIDPTTGHTVHDLYGTPAGFYCATGVREHNGTVYLGSLEGDTIAHFTVP